VLNIKQGADKEQPKEPKGKTKASKAFVFPLALFNG
jgi:hypothetical protein